MTQRIYSLLILTLFSILPFKNYPQSAAAKEEAFSRASYNAFHFRPVSEADLNMIIENKSQRKALWREAVQRRNKSLMESMLQKWPGLVNTCIDKNRNEPLDIAIKSGNPEEVNFFLEHGGQAGYTAMKEAESLAAQAKKELDLLKKKFQSQRSSYRLGSLIDLKKEIQKKEILFKQKSEIAKTIKTAHKKFMRDYEREMWPFMTRALNIPEDTFTRE